MSGTRTWPAERVERLLDLNAKGYSASRIGEELRCSRNAAIGKLHRLGVAKVAAGVRAPRRANKRYAAPKNRAVVVSRSTEARLPHRPYWERMAPVPPPPPQRGDVARVAFADLEPHHCRFPIGEPRELGFGFCGCARAPGSSYCQTHLARSLFSPVWVPSAIWIHDQISGAETEAAALQEFLEPA